MNKIYNPKPESWSTLLERPTKTVDDIEATVKEIFNFLQEVLSHELLETIG